MATPVFVLDTNIIISIIVNPRFDEFFTQNYINKYSNFVISVVTQGELEATAAKRKWGQKKRASIKRLLGTYLIHPIKLADIIKAYAEMDAYSQNKLDQKPLPKGMTARNMGKNDLWIAATAHVKGATLITTDKDFNHLDQRYLTLDLIDLASSAKKN